MALETDKAVLNQIYREGKLETDRQRRLRMGRDLIEEHHSRGSADYDTGELANLASIYFEDHRGQYPSLDEVVSDSSSDPVEYVGELAAHWMKAAAEQAGTAVTFSQIMGIMERQAALWLEDLINRRKHGDRITITGAKSFFPGTRVGGPDEED